MALDTSIFEIIRTPDGYYRHVCHSQGLLTSGWGSEAAAVKNADMYRGDAVGLERFRAKYQALYPSAEDAAKAPSAPSSTPRF